MSSRRSNRKKTACRSLRLQHSFGTRGNSGRDGADSDVNFLWCQEKRVQDIVVRLRGSSDPDKVPDKIGAGGADRRNVVGDLWKLGPIETAGGRRTAREARSHRLRTQE